MAKTKIKEVGRKRRRDMLFDVMMPKCHIEVFKPILAFRYS